MSRRSSARNRRSVRLAVLGVTCALAAAACGGAGGTETSGTEAATNGGVGEEGTMIEFDAANFVDPTEDTNPFHPLKPGLPQA